MRESIEAKQIRNEMILELFEDGLNFAEIGRNIGLSEGRVRDIVNGHSRYYDTSQVCGCGKVIGQYVRGGRKPTLKVCAECTARIWQRRGRPA